ncbi:MAG: glycogen/starch synthase [Candidatus Nanohaloarchaea archaeon]
MSPDNLIEVSFEVANKVGGIHQVLKSKAGRMKDFYGENYVTIGFYDEENAADEFVPRECPEYAEALEGLEKRGIKTKCGVWRVPGSPRCILIDPSGLKKDIDEIKEGMYQEYGVNSLNAGEDFDEPVKWSYAAGKVVDKLIDKFEGESVVHLHEWLSGPAIFEVDAPTVFTTHATVLGRTLSSSDFDLHGAVQDGEVDDKLASEYGVEAKHQLEKTAARESDVFTTVSKTTAKEAEAVLDRKPDVVLPNGFNVEEFPSLEELSYQHKKKKEELKEFLQAYFEPYYDIGLENDPRIMFISGRYEFHNKGLDIFIDALAELNEQEGDDFFVFIFVPSDTSGVKSEVLENMSLYQELEDYVDSVMPQIRMNLLNSLTSDEEPGEQMKELVDETSGEVNSLMRSFHSKKNDNPPLCAFDLNYYPDEILDRLYENGLRNREEDRVKVVFYPAYLSMGDKLLSMSYQDAIVACSAGIFPSYYEPWGYTPVETAANGALSITTDMAGFGQFLLEKTEPGDRKGIKVLEREGVPDEEAAEDLADMLEDIVSYSRTEITERKHNARRLAQLTSWRKLGRNYRKAHNKAIEKGDA